MSSVLRPFGRLGLSLLAITGLILFACGPSSSASPTSGASATPAGTSEPGGTAAPDTAAPGDTSGPGGTGAPIDTSAPGGSAGPGGSPEPGGSASPGTSPDGSASPGASPDASASPDGVLDINPSLAIVDLAGSVTVLTGGTCELTTGAGTPVAPEEPFETGLLVVDFQPSEEQVDVLPLTMTIFLQQRALDLLPEPSASPSPDPAATEAPEAGPLPFAVRSTSVDIGSLPGDAAATDATVIAGSVLSNGLGGFVLVNSSTGQVMSIAFGCTENSAEEPVLTPTATPAASPAASPSGSPEASPSGSPEASPSASAEASPSATP